MADTKVIPKEENGNGKKKAKAAAATWLVKHLGIPTVIAGLLATAAFNWFDAKTKDIQDSKAAILSIQKDIEFLKEQKGTDQAQWRAIQRFDDKLERVEITAAANEIILDKWLDDKFRSTGKPSEPYKKPDLIDRILGRNLEKKPMIIRRAGPKEHKSVEQYKEDQHNRYHQEQQQQQAP